MPKLTSMQATSELYRLQTLFRAALADESRPLSEALPIMEQIEALREEYPFLKPVIIRKRGE